jgi:hypothetical protein
MTGKTVKHLRSHFWNSTRLRRLMPVLLFIIIFGGLGSYLLTGSHAVNPYVSTTANQGILGGDACTQGNTTARNGTAVVFSGSSGSGIPIGCPFTDPNQLMKSPAVSYYDAPWRGYMQTEPATQFLDGIGINYNPIHDTPADDAANLHYLASIGIHAIRVELPWDAVSPTDETLLNASSAAKFSAIFADCKADGITPTVLLNANDGGPEPSYQTYSATVVGIPAIGDSQITVSGIPASDITVHQAGTSTGSSGINFGAGGGEAANLITKVTTNSDGSLTLSLSQPLAALPTSTKITIYYLKYLPLYPVGTPEFNNTMSGWMQYVKTATNTVEAAGITNYSVEIWNELTFGSLFLNINAYYPSTAPLIASVPSTLFSGGSDWELGNQTTQYLKSTYGSKVNVIWGFSNTTFYHTPDIDLPANIDGESYHPYGTGLTTGAGVLDPNSSQYLREGSYVPNVNIAIPEGTEALPIKIEQLIRGKLAPDKREASLPPSTTNFLHYITETGLDPREDGSFSQAENQLLKAKAFLREYSFWLNKGLDQFDVFAAFDSSANDAGFNMLATGADSGAASPTTLQSQSVANFTAQFAGASSLSAPRQLGVSVNDITPNDNTAAYQVFPADPASGEPALNYREMFQFLPFQVTNNKFVISTYVMSWDLASPPPPMDFQVNITNVNGNSASVSYYDPITNTSEPVSVVSRGSNNIVLNIQSLDYPRLISISD